MMKLFLFWPLVLIVVISSAFTGFFLRDVTGLVVHEQPSAFDHVQEEQIFVADGHVRIDVDGKDLVWSTFTDSNSMDPFLDKGHNGLSFVPTSFTDIHVGDVVAFMYEGRTYVHRVVAIGFDGDGWYAQTKGDNSGTLDHGKRRFSDISSVYFGVIF